MWNLHGKDSKIVFVNGPFVHQNQIDPKKPLFF